MLPIRHFACGCTLYTVPYTLNSVLRPVSPACALHVDLLPKRSVNKVANGFCATPRKVYELHMAVHHPICCFRDKPLSESNEPSCTEFLLKRDYPDLSRLPADFSVPSLEECICPSCSSDNGKYMAYSSGYIARRA